MHIEIFQEPQSYHEILNRQRVIFNNMVEEKRISGKAIEEHLIILEHEPVITLGRRAKESNLLVSESGLKSRNIDIYRIERGGDVTYHGPGQVVMYPLIDLNLHHLGVKDYVRLLEESVIRILEEYGIKGERIDGATGVWIGKGTDRERKICAIGVKCSRFVTMHGLALNVNTDLSAFSLINPCGFTDKGMTSIAREKGDNIDIDEVKIKLRDIFINLLEEKTLHKD